MVPIRTGEERTTIWSPLLLVRVNSAWLSRIDSTFAFGKVTSTQARLLKLDVGLRGAVDRVGEAVAGRDEEEPLGLGLVGVAAGVAEAAGQDGEGVRAGRERPAEGVAPHVRRTHADGAAEGDHHAVRADQAELVAVDRCRVDGVAVGAAEAHLEVVLGVEPVASEVAATDGGDHDADRAVGVGDRVAADQVGRAADDVETLGVGPVGRRPASRRR